ARQARGDDRQEGSLLGCWVLEVVWKVGVEGNAIALPQLIAMPVADQHHLPALDQGALAAAGLVHRRIVGRAGRPAWSERVPRQLGALSGLGKAQHLEAGATTRVSPAGAVPRPRHRDRPPP